MRCRITSRTFSALLLAAVLACGGGVTAPETATLRLPHTAFSPATEHDAGVWRAGWLEPASLPAHQEFRATFSLPSGAEITGARASLYRETGHELAIVGVWGTTSSGAAVGLVSLAHDAVGWHVVTGTAIQEEPSTAYRVEIELGVPSTERVADVRLAYVEIDYR